MALTLEILCYFCLVGCILGVFIGDSKMKIASLLAIISLGLNLFSLYNS